MGIKPKQGPAMKATLAPTQGKKTAEATAAVDLAVRSKSTTLPGLKLFAVNKKS